MQTEFRSVLTGASLGLGAVLSAPALAADPGTMEVSVTIPQLKVAEYHRPYVAIWVEKAGAPAKTVAIWYDHDMKNNEGTKWLRDVRQWWRASGPSSARWRRPARRPTWRFQRRWAECPPRSCRRPRPWSCCKPSAPQNS